MAKKTTGYCGGGMAAIWRRSVALAAACAFLIAPGGMAVVPAHGQQVAAPPATSEAAAPAPESAPVPEAAPKETAAQSGDAAPKPAIAAPPASTPADAIPEGSLSPAVPAPERPQDTAADEPSGQSPVANFFTTLPWWVWAIGGVVIVAAASGGGGGGGGSGSGQSTGEFGASW